MSNKDEENSETDSLSESMKNIKIKLFLRSFYEQVSHTHTEIVFGTTNFKNKNWQRPQSA